MSDDTPTRPLELSPGGDALAEVLCDDLTLPDRYQQIEPIGQGGMGMVVRAHDSHLQRVVAIKILKDRGPEAQARFLREARSLAALHHPNILPVHDIGQLLDGRPYIVMRWLSGGSWKERVRSEPPRWSDAVAILEQISDALVLVHDQGIVHRDLKPANILFDDADVPHVCDFGVARVAQDHNVTTSGQVLGTLAWMAPEQLQGRATPASDIYALGLLLAWASTGERSPDRLSQRLPHAVATLVQQCTALDPTTRPRDAREFQDQLRRILADSDEGTSATKDKTSEGPSRKHLNPLAFLAVAGVLAGTFIALGTRTGSSRHSTPEQGHQNATLEDAPPKAARTSSTISEITGDEGQPAIPQGGNTVTQSALARDEPSPERTAPKIEDPPQATNRVPVREAVQERSTDEPQEREDPHATAPTTAPPGQGNHPTINHTPPRAAIIGRPLTLLNTSEGEAISTARIEYRQGPESRRRTLQVDQNRATISLPIEGREPLSYWIEGTLKGGDSFSSGNASTPHLVPVH